MPANAENSSIKKKSKKKKKSVIFRPEGAHNVSPKDAFTLKH